MLTDVSELPPAGVHRGRALGPRELLARSGSHTISPPLHPRIEELHVALPHDHDPARHSMRLSRTPPDRLLAMSMTPEMTAGARPAGIGGFFQSAKTRSEFKQMAVVGQFSHEVPSSIPGTRKLFQSVRAEGPSFQPHQQATTAFRRDLERSGHL
ncbi:unnamed protein product [Polarella glacialis]|uniref:Uncharacterized protein n=1 Tax=Polarella glacialis TaxID=89957 RepID=A0A813LM25_POLGL|nr:unnamed protein product [Polarella glacialis]CAE8607691.1 unnamed protein product [Polarella glacialis]CAE8613301.1 unnamed protein product [Polarella glacialis]CAE8737626.1 unnamed protein product [Polarella glacialis]|mmetsp:Transcript_99201/g.179173  ORF Transcript_99201/g.179173 Transcript_99201/m.179173 type:complete len:155 (+) Transcript_99201:65-529(+)|eukprot:CAMPEP_0115099514 /NCGR_PEP_ID=MMETSP0227-20121206/31905_1 /TAXON_ID=89957 /ORGANISM="Polarella glacialis, Strain CCMP 1383" /LENGTH=154 /DNA_ID=CAMNT_0002494535 /DNA_START=60 /DNA_END=524 /DNA_ORIENTATION=-